MRPITTLLSQGELHRQAIRRSRQFYSSVSETSTAPIYVAATRQDVGKTTTSLAIMSGLQKRFDRVGFMKPVGQKCITMTDETGCEANVDKDVAVLREHFHLDHCPIRLMNPVRIVPGYTREYVDGKHSNRKQIEDIENAYRVIGEASDIVLCEGTGHSAVGSIIGTSNARVAAALGAKMVSVSALLVR